MTARRFFCTACQSECFELAGTCRGCGAPVTTSARLRTELERLDAPLAGALALLLAGFIVGVGFSAVTRERDIEDLARARACERAR